MAERVKPRRVYRSVQREAQAAATRANVVAAARMLFVDKGWEATTVAAVARAAGASPETIYATFGNKAALFVEVVRATVRGDTPDIPLLDQPGPKAVAAATNQREVIRLFASGITPLLERVAPLMAAALGAAQTEPAIAALYRQIHKGRRENFRLVSSALARNGPLKAGLTEETATDAIWRLTSPELFAVMTRYQGMSTAGYTKWLVHSLSSLLLQP
jgi:AcrR family transcriptional regulator